MAAVRIVFLFLLLGGLPLSCPLSEKEALLKLKQSFTHSGSLNSWNADSVPCSARWTGIICNKGVITGLHLSGLQLSGTIDVEALIQLPRLRTISLIDNKFTGPIPEFNKIGVLKALLLTRNQFFGDIPDDFFSTLTSLKKVYLSSNNFSGNIPNSLAQLSHLLELHLDRNQFSGPLPNLKYASIITSLDVSNNNLQGQIPDSLSKFDAKAFAGNEGLCGNPLPKSCEDNASPPPPPGESQANISKLVVASLIAVVVFLMVFIFLSASKRREDEFSMLGRDREEVVEVHVPGSAQDRQSIRRGGGDSRRGSKQGKAGMTDLVVINDERGTFGMADLMKAAAEVLGNGGLGSAYKAVMSNGLSVVVKRMREMNKIGKDGFDAEMRRLGRLRHQNILTPLAYHYRREEKLVVSEYVPKGSLLYVLHGDRGACHADLDWETRLIIVKGIASGLGFLHSEFATYDLPHGNLKSSNVLLCDDYEPLLSDYAFHPLINPSNASQAMFAYKAPEYAQNQEVSPKSDVYCLGIIILEIMTSKFPSQYLTNGKGGTDVVQWVSSAVAEKREAELIDPEIANDAPDELDRMVQLLTIGADCTHATPQQRPDMKEAIRRIEEI
ncbi:pollen receptor-like kinase 3 [Cucurbita pepo subsp. pepo]|uniref:pollen receptor-like kinase 3 n=1 Tax=Cucurbita pepo subsp. pepo TaxID=3664 RepID=UPI000C9D4164|nr:pollen receptor-like kinase 3 [Cucurbita pepo subsp. pepo]